MESQEILYYMSVCCFDKISQKHAILSLGYLLHRKELF